MAKKARCIAAPGPYFDLKNLFLRLDELEDEAVGLATD